MFKYLLLKVLSFLHSKLYGPDDWSIPEANNVFYDNMHCKISVWENYKEGWDGETAVPPCHVVVQNARSFIDLMKSKKSPVPLMALAPDGEIIFRWYNGFVRASLSFLDDGTVVGYSPSVDNTAEVSVDAVYCVFQINHPIAQFLNAIDIIFYNQRAI